MFKNKVLLISGGTGTFGNAVMSKFLNSDLKEIRIFSRDEKKQDDLRRQYKSVKLKFYIGDVRDYQSINAAMKDVDYVFHAAALKQVPSCEFHPMEAVKTNIIGTENIIESAIARDVKKVICLSTDKAVYPINAMGISKAMMEKVMIAKSRTSNKTIICGTRYGNVMGSRGSVIPLFLNQILSKEKLTITDPEMTRFMMTIEDAVDLVLYAFLHGKSGQIFVQKSPAASIKILANAMLELFGSDSNFINIIGTRHGEKLYETLLSREEMASANDLGNYFSVEPDMRDLNYEKYFDKGDGRITNSSEFHSHNTRQLDIAEMKDILLKLSCISDALAYSKS
jgi:UDP-glucose 4-epimerase